MKQNLLIHMQICGFPKFSCGHDALLLVVDDKPFLYADLRVYSPLRLSSWKYWPRVFFSNTLPVRIIIKQEEEARSLLRGVYEESLSFSCEAWDITSEQTSALVKIIQQSASSAQEEKHPFCMAGRMVSAFFGCTGYNCKDWVHDVLKEAGIASPARPFDNHDLPLRDKREAPISKQSFALRIKT